MCVLPPRKESWIQPRIPIPLVPMCREVVFQS